MPYQKASNGPWYDNMLGKHHFSICLLVVYCDLSVFCSLWKPLGGLTGKFYS